MSEDAAYSDKGDVYFAHVRREIELLLPDKISRVMEIGCGAGDTLNYLKQTGRCDWVCGVELESGAAAQAREKLDMFIEGNIEHQNLPMAPESLDVILCLDVLEHLVDPWNVIHKLDKLLKPGGSIIASIPNVRHFHVSLPLLFRGKWQYVDAGLLDKTHLRFFVHDSAVELMECSGLRVDMVRTKGLEKGSKAWLVNMATLSLFRPLFEYQYLIRAIKVK